MGHTAGDALVPISAYWATWPGVAPGASYVVSDQSFMERGMGREMGVHPRGTQ
jgi:hypothetical protein